MSEYIYTWEFDDTKNRSTLWYVIALSIVLWLSIWWFITKQYGMSFIVLLIAGLVYFVENNSDDRVEVKISNIWVKIANTFYDFNTIESYWIVYKWEEAKILRFFLKKKWIKNIDVQINNKIITDIINALDNNVVEVPRIDLTFSEKLIQLLKL
jgi:hypothetical protein